MVWTNYMSPCSSIVGLYFKGTCERKDVTFLTGRQPREFQVSFGRAK